MDAGTLAMVLPRAVNYVVSNAGNSAIFESNPAADDFCCAHNETDGLLDLPWSLLREAVPEVRRHAAMGCELHSDQMSSGRESAECGIETASAPHATSSTESAG